MGPEDIDPEIAANTSNPVPAENYDIVAEMYMERTIECGDRKREIRRWVEVAEGMEVAIRALLLLGSKEVAAERKRSVGSDRDG
jgi:hypothetical protein